MSTKKKLCILATLFLSLSFVGCGDSEGGRGRFSLRRRSADTASSRSRSRRRRRSADARTRIDKREFDDMSPELSMSRDLERLREQEKVQADTVSEMRNALAQGQDAMTAEERKLRQIQGKISDYDLRMRRYESASAIASRSYDDGGFAAPASMYQEPRRQAPDRRELQPGRIVPVDYEYEGDRGYARESARSAPPRDMEYDRAQSYGGREVMVYDGRPAARGDAYRQPDQSARAHEEFTNPFAAPADRREGAPVPVRRQTGEDAWDVPAKGFYSDSPTASPVTTPNRDSSGSRQRQPSAERGGPVSVQPGSSGAPTGSGAGGSVQDEVFSPDLYLGR